jgi:predicted nuclease of predicted toxin-antitoxin system
MPKFIVDENMPRSTARLLRELGYEVKDIRDYGLRGAEDEEIYEFAQKEEAVILTYDREFGNILRFPLGKHFGIIIAHFPNEISTKEINRCLLERLKDISEEDIKGNLIIIEVRKTRIRRKEKLVKKI